MQGVLRSKFARDTPSCRHISKNCLPTELRYAIRSTPDNDFDLPEEFHEGLYFRTTVAGAGHGDWHPGNEIHAGRCLFEKAAFMRTIVSNQAMAGPDDTLEVEVDIKWDNERRVESLAMVLYRKGMAYDGWDAPSWDVPLAPGDLPAMLNTLQWV